NVALVHLPFSFWVWSERRNLLVDHVVPRDIGNQIFDHRKCMHRFDGYRRIHRQSVEAGLAGKPGPTINLGRARATFACFAVPADGEIRRLMRLNVVQSIEHYHPRRERYPVLNEFSTFSIAAKDLECCVRHGSGLTVSYPSIL